VELQVRFEEEHFGRYAVNFEGRNLGLDFVDEARAKTDLPHLPIEICDKYAYSNKCNPEIEISEDYARASGHFGEKHYIHVIVAEGHLNQYAVPDIETTRTADGQITRCSRSYKLLEPAVLAAWAAAEYPLVWGKEEATEE